MVKLSIFFENLYSLNGFLYLLNPFRCCFVLIEILVLKVSKIKNLQVYLLGGFYIELFTTTLLINYFS